MAPLNLNSWPKRKSFFPLSHRAVLPCSSFSTYFPEVSNLPITRIRPVHTVLPLQHRTDAPAPYRTKWVRVAVGKACNLHALLKLRVGFSATQRVLVFPKDPCVCNRCNLAKLRSPFIPISLHLRSKLHSEPVRSDQHDDRLNTQLASTSHGALSRPLFGLRLEFTGVHGQLDAV